MSDPNFNIIWATHPRHLPDVPPGHVIVLDVACCGGSIRVENVAVSGLVELHYWIDHHYHPEAWARVADDPRFILVPNHIAHACPELITEELVLQSDTRIDTIIAHCDFDGALSAVKWILQGKEPWEGADEDARAIDSPGRGHALTTKGEHISFAMDEIHSATKPAKRFKYMTELVWAMVHDKWPADFKTKINELAQRARQKEEQARIYCDKHGHYEAKDVFVVRLEHKVDNQDRKYFLVAAEMKSRVGVLIERDPMGGNWITVATFDPTIDLSKIKGLDGGRSDYRFARAKKGGRAQIEQIQNYVNEVTQ